MRATAFAFDAYGTLFDVHAAIARYGDRLGPDAQAAAELWRFKQLEYSWTRSLMGRPLDFWTMTEQALDYVFAAVPGLDRSLRPQLLDAYRELAAFPDTADVLRGLHAAGRRLAIFTNGGEPMVRAAAAAAGVAELFEAIISVEPIGVYKTAPAAYAELGRRLLLPADQIVLLSSNRWDVAGAANAGLRTIWLNRGGRPDEYPDLPPDRIVTDLRELLAHPA